MTLLSPTDATRNNRLILGIDPGTNVLGYGLLKVAGRKAAMMTMGVIDMRRCADAYLKLGRIHERINNLIEAFSPDELAIEAPFFGKNVQSMLKLGRAQGVVIGAAIAHHMPVHEYAPLKVKMAITGNGQASKEQVADMLKRMLKIDDKQMLPFFDATDALAVAYCHYLQDGPQGVLHAATAKSWKDFVKQNKSRLSRPLRPSSIDTTSSTETICKK